MSGISVSFARAALVCCIFAASVSAQTPGPAELASRNQCDQSASVKLAQLPLFSSGQAQHDLMELVDEMRKAHSGNEDYLTPAEFDEQVALAKSKLAKPVNAYQLALVVMQLLNSTHDGHAALIEPRAVRLMANTDAILFPFNVRILDRRIYAAADLTPDRSVPAGSEILSIDDAPSDQVLDSLAEFFTADGFGKAGLYRSFEYEGWRPFRRSFAFIKGYPASYTIGYRDYRTGQINSIAVCAISAAQASERMEQQPSYAPTRNNDFPPKTPLVSFSIKDGTGVLRIARLVEKDYDEPDSLFDDYYRDAFRQLGEQGVKNLVIDLRDNGGGMGSHGAVLLPYLVSRPVTPLEGAWGKLPAFGNYGQDNENYEKHVTKGDDGKYHLNSTEWLREMRTYQPSKDLAYHGRLFVLIDGGTISAAAQLAGFLREFTSATFVGEETSGAAGISNGVIQLPVGADNSGVGVLLPAVHSDSNIAKEMRKRPVAIWLYFASVESHLRLEKGHGLYLEKTIAVL